MVGTATVPGPGPLDPRRWPLVGRDDELALATTALIEQGCVVLTGAAGVGKTRLAHEVLAAAATADDRTEWVAATHAAAAVPLGAIAHLIPASALGQRRDAALRGIVRALHGTGDARPPFVGVDDAHLLDEASAALVALLVRSGSAAVVVTLRSGETAPDAIVALVEGQRRAVDRVADARARRGRHARHLGARRRGRGLDAPRAVGVERRQRALPARARLARARIRGIAAPERTVALARSARARRSLAGPDREADGQRRRRRAGRTRVARGRSAPHGRLPPPSSPSPTSRRGWNGADSSRRDGRSIWRSRWGTRSSAKCSATA